MVEIYPESKTILFNKSKSLLKNDKQLEEVQEQYVTRLTFRGK